MNLKSARYILLLIIVAFAMYGIVTVNLALQKWVYLLATVYIVTLVVQAFKEQKKQLALFYAVLGIMAFILFILGFQ